MAPSEKGIIHFILNHPKVAGFIACLSLAATFSPRASGMASWVCLVLAGCFGSITIWTIPGLRRRHIYRIPEFSLTLAMLVGLILYGQWLSGGSRPSAKAEPFAVAVKTAIVSDSGPLTFFMVGYPSMFGATASPIFYLACLQITNLQDIPTMISDIKIAASKEQDGPWEDLVPISLVTDTLYNLGTATPYPKTLEFPPGTYRLAKVMTRDDMKQSAVLTASSILESEIAKPIEPHHTIYGWVALDSLRHVGLTPGQIFFRVKLLDAAKKSGTYVAELPRRQPGESSITPDVPTIRVVGVRADISKFYVSYYDDPYPTPLAKQ